MSFQFCWEFTGCKKPCAVRDLRLLCCWNHFAEERAAGLRPCDTCSYRLAWEGCGMRAAEFPSVPGRRTGAVHRRSILVVDDEPNILYALKETVSQRGRECIAAPDGENGLALARGLLPDLVISDIIMPRMNGYELCLALKEDESTRHIPVILVTVRTSEMERLAGGLVGAQAYIFKPFHLRELEEALDRLLPPG